MRAILIGGSGDTSVATALSYKKAFPYLDIPNWKVMFFNNFMKMIEKRFEPQKAEILKKYFLPMLNFDSNFSPEEIKCSFSPATKQTLKQLIDLIRVDYDAYESIDILIAFYNFIGSKRKEISNSLKNFKKIFNNSRKSQGVLFKLVHGFLKALLFSGENLKNFSDMVSEINKNIVLGGTNFLNFISKIKKNTCL